MGKSALVEIRGKVPEWAKNSGYGSGYGSGDGSGYGYGDGSGYGYGDGSGYGYGDGYGYGSGYGYGYGDGSGYGSGSGYGYGDGSGYGSGDGYGNLPTGYAAEAFSVFEKVKRTKDGRLILFKVVKPKERTDHYTGKIKYEGVVTCPDWNPSPQIQCGNGLHVSPTVEAANRYHKGQALRVAVRLEDISVYWMDMSKVRVRELEVLGDVE